MLENKKILLLLELINGNGSVQRLIHDGLDYTEIGNLIEYSLSEFWVDNSKEKLTLTTQGLEKFQELKIQLKRIDKNSWIEPQKSDKILIIKKNDVFLPNQNELHFD